MANSDLNRLHRREIPGGRGIIHKGGGMYYFQHMYASQTDTIWVGLENFSKE
jgi:hypothetical protein